MGVQFASRGLRGGAIALAMATVLSSCATSTVAPEIGALMPSSYQPPASGSLEESMLTTAKVVEIEANHSRDFVSNLLNTDLKLRVAVSQDRTFALIDASGAKSLTGFDIESAARKASGCPAVWDGGGLRNAPGFRKETPFPPTKVIRVAVYCDNRKRVKGLVARRFPNAPRADTTVLTCCGRFGFQIEYFDKSGNVWLWYPRNTRLLKGQWKKGQVVIDTTGQMINGSYMVMPVYAEGICFKYGPNTYNPASKKSGGDWQCNQLVEFTTTLVAEENGDIFNLRSGKLPYRRDRCDPTDKFVFERERAKCA